jgi:PAS domain S-box-containing protein
MENDVQKQVVKQFEKLNLEYDKELQQTVSLTAKLFKTPVSFIALAGDDNELQKVKNDLNVDLTAADLSFCRQKLVRNGVLIVNDSIIDDCFSTYPGAESGFKMRFYASAPLINSSNVLIGVLCIMDDKPHNFGSHDKLTFKIMAKHITSIIELKKNVNLLDISFKELEKERNTGLNNELKLRTMFESLTDAYILLGTNYEVLDFNRAASASVKDKLGLCLSYGVNLLDIIPESYRDCFVRNFKKALRGKTMQTERFADYGLKGKVWWDCTFEPVKNKAGEVIGVSYVSRNITDRKLSEEKVTEQNHMLTKIAEIQSHEYRGPVASILGIMSLIEKNDYEAPKDYLIMMQGAVEKLDEKIHDVVNIVNNL